VEGPEHDDVEQWLRWQLRRWRRSRSGKGARLWWWRRRDSSQYVSKWFYDTSTGAVTGAVPLWFFCWRGSDRTRCWLSGNTVDTKIYAVRAAGA
jgi:hypothetical protein